MVHSYLMLFGIFIILYRNAHQIPVFSIGQYDIIIYEEMCSHLGPVFLVNGGFLNCYLNDCYLHNLVSCEKITELDFHLGPTSLLDS